MLLYSHRRQTENASSGEERPSLFRFHLSQKIHLPDLGWIQNSRWQEEEEQTANKRILGPRPSSELRFWASSCPVLEVSAAHLFIVVNLFIFSLPSLGHGILPFAYFGFLLILLVHRSPEIYLIHDPNCIFKGCSEMRRNALGNMGQVGKPIVSRFKENQSNHDQLKSKIQLSAITD